MKNIPDVSYLLKLCDLSLKYGVDEAATNSIKEEIWNRKTDKDVWSYIAKKELEVPIFFMAWQELYCLL